MSEMMPAAFLGHGSPMNALDHNGYTEAWRAFGGLGTTTSRDPRRLRALVHQRIGRNGHEST
jgi:4,5-DOPA dioxygenase extradiol